MIDALHVRICPSVASGSPGEQTGSRRRRLDVLIPDQIYRVIVGVPAEVFLQITDDEGEDIYYFVVYLGTIYTVVGKLQPSLRQQLRVQKSDIHKNYGFNIRLTDCLYKILPYHLCVQLVREPCKQTGTSHFIAHGNTTMFGVAEICGQFIKGSND